MSDSDEITMGFTEDFQRSRMAASRKGLCVKLHHPMPKKVGSLDECFVKVSQRASGFVQVPDLSSNFANRAAKQLQKVTAPKRSIRFGLTTDIETHSLDVCFTPKADIPRSECDVRFMS
jgi:hypothetical protein